MKICLCTGSVALTAWPSSELSTGTSRQPSSVRPSSLIAFSTIFWATFRPSLSRGMKSWPTPYWPGSGRAMPIAAHSCGEEAVRDLDQDAAAVAHHRIGADGAAVGEVPEDREPLLDDGVRLHVLHVGDEADAAGVLLVLRVVESLARR